MWSQHDTVPRAVEIPTLALPAQVVLEQWEMAQFLRRTGHAGILGSGNPFSLCSVVPLSRSM